MADVIIKYSKTFYEAKVSELDGYLQRLEQHRANLENLRDQIKQYWEDDQSKTYFEVMSQQIRAIRTSKEHTQALRDIYNNAVNQMGGAQGTVDTLMSDALSAIQGLGLE